MTQAGIDFVVLTGFLGSGKTTLLREFLGTDEAGETAIIVNEVGEIGLDGALLREAGGDVAMTMLANGCVCCQVGTDLTLTVESLLAAPRPDSARPLRRIVLETSGLSKPGPVLRQIAPLASHRMRLSVVATFDAARGPETQTFEEAAAQWAGAHRIVVTKLDTMPEARLAEAASEVALVNPLAEVVALRYRSAASRAAFAPPLPGALSLWPDPHAQPGRAAGPHPRMTTFLLRQSAAIRYDDLAEWLDNLAGALGDRLLRLKGLIQVAESDRPLLVQSVGTVFSQPRAFGGVPPAGGSFLVVIGRDLAADEIEAVLPRLPLELGRGTAFVSNATASLGRRSLRAEAV
ncbi:CobW family GTP-binding protein [uncultured Enterovirga sp.]|uniref:CobW family GTP-binding protein n=1 Tax=uncultured Enterovirga sp. TaxID=2026352 RepID=UPI0035CB45AB